MRDGLQRAAILLKVAPPGKDYFPFQRQLDTPGSAT